MMRRVTAILAGAAAAALVGCIFGSKGEIPEPDLPQPAIELGGSATARRIEGWMDVPSGEGADGAPGDFLLENAFARFVVGGPGRGALSGNLIDAVTQGGEDMLRLLAPAAGVDALRRPACTDVSLASPGGMGEAAVVEATGHLRGDPRVDLVTSYRLEPDTSSLEIQTKVTNSGSEVIDGLYMGDVVHHGRTIRYAPDGGLMPVGRRTQSKWLAFCHGRFVWGLISSPLSRVDARHYQGGLTARYAVDLIPPGESRTYRRYLAAEVGGTPRIAQLAGSYSEAEKSRLEVVVSDEDGKPVAGARAVLAPAAAWPLLLITNEDGRAVLDTAAGKASLTVWAPGRAPWGPVEVATAIGGSHRQTVTLSEPARVEVKVVGEIAGMAAPSAARVASFVGPRDPLPFPVPPPFPMPGFSGVVLTLGHEGALLPMPAARTGSRAVSLLTASRGPLFDLGSNRAEAAAGQTAHAVLTVRRAVDPGDYVAVDCRRHTLACTDSPLTRAEQLLSAACDGVDVAVLASPRVEPVVVDNPEMVQCHPVNSVRIVRDGLGSFSVYPVDERACDEARFRQLTAAEVPADQLLAELRACFPDAVIQVDEPLHPSRGYFAAEGFDVLKRTEVPEGLSRDFDAIELLTGDGVAGAQALLAHWFKLLNDGRRVFVTGSSGLRALDLGTTGATRTFVRREPGPAGRRQGALERALRSLRSLPDAFVTNGPFLQVSASGRPMGSTVAAVDGGVKLHVRVSAPGWVDVARVTVYRNGVVLRELSVPPAQDVTRLEQDVAVDAPSDCWLVVVVEGDRPMTPAYSAVAGAPTPFAVSNPIWVDADGDGEVGRVTPLAQ